MTTMRVKRPNRFLILQRLQRQDRPHKTGIDARFKLEYMGSSEYEWGAPGDSLRRMRALGPAATLESTITVEGITRTVWLVGPAEDLAGAREDLERTLNDDSWAPVERSYAKEHAVGQVKDYMAYTSAWWSFDDDVTFTFDAEVAQALRDGLDGLCGNCDGRGWVAEHDALCQGGGECLHCPVQVPCPTCGPERNVIPEQNSPAGVAF